MKLVTVAALVAFGTAPVVASMGVEWLGVDDVERVLHGENVTDVAAEIARREFNANARLAAWGDDVRDTTRAEWGDDIRARDGHEYHHVRFRLENVGKLDLAVHTSHFRAQDELGRWHRAELGLAHLVDERQLATGAAVDGIVVFDLIDGLRLTTLEWGGAFANATASLDGAPPAEYAGPTAPPGPDDSAAPRDEGAPGAKPDDEAEDEYRSHWDG